MISRKAWPRATSRRLCVSAQLPSSVAFFSGGTSTEALCTDAVFGGKHYNGGCCFDYGNAESNNLDTGAGSMEVCLRGASFPLLGCSFDGRGDIH